nr:hypothetical protein [Tanacetum cinerariifolium]
MPEQTAIHHSTPVVNHLKLLGFSKDKEPIVEAMIFQQTTSPDPQGDINASYGTINTIITDEKPEPNYHKWEKFMSFEPDIPETPLYKSKLIISKHYKKETDVKVGNIFDNKEALDLAIRLKDVEDGY